MICRHNHNCSQGKAGQIHKGVRRSRDLLLDDSMKTESEDTFQSGGGLFKDDMGNVKFGVEMEETTLKCN